MKGGEWLGKHCEVLFGGMIAIIFAVVVIAMICSPCTAYHPYTPPNTCGICIDHTEDVSWTTAQPVSTGKSMSMIYINHEKVHQHLCCMNGSVYDHGWKEV